MPEIELDHVQIAAPPGCEPAARRFFGDLLGLAEIEKPEPLRGRGGVWFALGERQLHVGVEPEFAPARKAHVGLRVGPGEIDGLAERLAAAGSGDLGRRAPRRAPLLLRRPLGQPDRVPGQGLIATR